jgi:hypothetical protein
LVQEIGSITLNRIKTNLKTKLTEISAFAKSENLTSWADWFDKAIYALDSATPYEKDQDLQIIPSGRRDLQTIQLLASSAQAWCFGGMGSWNDIYFKEKDKNEVYDRLSADLYEIVNESYLAVANSQE